MKGPLEHDRELARRKPTVPGEAVEYIYIPARGFMRARYLEKGQVIRIIDLEGQQVPDSIIWDANNFENAMSCTNTMGALHRWSKFPIGSCFYSQNGDRMVIISDDTTDGTHAMAGGFCNEANNRVKYGIEGTPNCRDNFVAAMAPYGFTSNDIDWGSCISHFMEFRYNDDGTSEILEPRTKPGDYLDLMAEMDIIIAISNCPQERNACNAYNPTPIQVVIFNPDKDYVSRAKASSDLVSQASSNLYRIG